MRHFCLLCAVFAFSGLFTTRARAADEEAGAVPADAKEDSGGFSFEGQEMFPTSYVFCGYVLLEDHFIVQPEATVSYGTKFGDLTITPYLTAWANLTDASAPGDPEWFNEFDLYLGVDIELPFGFTLGLVYDYYNSPANVFDDDHELGITLSHDDFLHPSVGLYREVCNHGGKENTYIELGLEPGFDVPNFEKLRIDFPIMVGLTPDEYYTDSSGDGEVFGYWAVGLTGTYAVNDNWSLLAGIDYVQLTADSTEASNHGDDHQIVGRFAVKFSH